jgi:hypothetical protein
MRLRVFQAEKGDCILVTTASGRHMLADGGMADSYTEFVAPELERLRLAGDALDLVYVSHIDEDHISGILKMLDDLVDWRVFEHHGAGSSAVRPDSHRPPEIRGIWHNAFHEQITRNQGRIERMFAADVGRLLDEAARALAIFDDDDAPPDRRDIARYFRSLVTSKRQAIEVSRRIGDSQLGIPLNEEYDNRLMYVADPPDPIRLGSMRITVIGPFDDELRKLRDKWNDWLRTQGGRRALRSIRREARDDEARLHPTEVDTFMTAFGRDAEAQLAIELANAEIFQPPRGLAAAKPLGRRSRVTTPNLASLMLLLEEGNQSVLMTGDGHSTDILDGLRTVGRLDANDQIHVDVLKVQHHGSEHNIDEEFCESVIADHYVFCGNGEHENPEPDVVQAIVDSRLPGNDQSTHPHAGDPFKLWFNASSQVRDPGDRAHMRKIERKVNRLRTQSNGQMRAPFFLRGDSFTIDVG